MPEKPQPSFFKTDMKKNALSVYGRILDVIVTVLIFILLLTLVGALAGLVMDFYSASNAFHDALASHNLAHGIVDGIDRELVVDVLSVFVLIELFRTFTDYLEYRRVRLRVLAEVGIAFILREVFISLYSHGINANEIFALSVLLAVLIAARIAAVKFQPLDDGKE